MQVDIRWSNRLALQILLPLSGLLLLCSCSTPTLTAVQAPTTAPTATPPPPSPAPSVRPTATGWTRVTAEPVRAVAAGGWYATAGRVCRWDEGTPFCPPADDGQNLRGVQVLASGPETGALLAVDGQGRYWLYQEGKDSFSPFSDTVYLDGIVPQQVQDVAFSPQRWYYATSRGVYEGEASEAFPGSPIVHGGALGGAGPIDVRDLSLDGGAVWAASAQGAFYLAGTQEARWSYVTGLPSYDLMAVAATDSGAWFGTANGRVLYFERSP